MGYGLDIVTGPAAEPITLEEAKRQLNVTGADFDTVIGEKIKYAREECEAHTHRAIITQSWKLTLDRWPCRPNESGVNRHAIFLPHPPIQSVTSVKYIDADGVQQTLVANTDYIASLSEPYPRVCPYYGTAWPAVRADYPLPIEIIFVAGYGTVMEGVPPTNIPGRLRDGMLLRIADLFENRSSEVSGTQVSQFSNNVERCFDMHAVPNFAEWN